MLVKVRIARDGLKTNATPVVTEVLEPKDDSIQRPDYYDEAVVLFSLMMERAEDR
jgi:hypothetical protein